MPVRFLDPRKQGILSPVQNENPVLQEVLSEETSPGSASELTQCHTMLFMINSTREGEDTYVVKNTYQKGYRPA